APLLIAHVEKEHPEAPLILETLSRAYMHHLMYRPAHACLSRWLEIEPDAARAYHWRGWVFERINQPQDAIKDYKEALELAPDLFAIRVRLVEMLLDDNRTLEAVPHLELLLGQYPDLPVIKARLGQCRFVQGEHDEARRLLQEAAEDLPRDPY